jgi:hypothetical protein
MVVAHLLHATVLVAQKECFMVYNQIFVAAVDALSNCAYPHILLVTDTIHKLCPTIDTSEAEKLAKDVIIYLTSGLRLI